MTQMPKIEREYSIERRLAELSPELHQRYRDCVTVSWQMLSRYETYFPEYTDHSVLHTLDILDLCNRLIGTQLDRLNAQELYVLMMGALFHDVGMGVSKTDYARFREKLGLPETSDPEILADNIRSMHQELSGLYVEKYAALFELPNDSYTHAVIQLCRGHRKTDLMDEQGYPSAYEVEPGKTVCLPYLAALICLADELDITAERNVSFLYDIDSLRGEIGRFEFRKHEATRRVELEADKVVVYAWSDDEAVRRGVEETVDKLRDKLFMCRRVAAERSSFEIAQTDVLLRMIPPEVE